MKDIYFFLTSYFGLGFHNCIRSSEKIYYKYILYILKLITSSTRNKPLWNVTDVYFIYVIFKMVSGVKLYSQLS